LPSALFLLGMVLMQISAVQAIYLGAHKRELFAALSAVAAPLVAALSCYFGEVVRSRGHRRIILRRNVAIHSARWNCRPD
jgi:hypothetical protein